MVPSSSGLRRSAGALLPRRAGAETEPEWKLYEEGDPNLFDNWKGKVRSCYILKKLSLYKFTLISIPDPPPMNCS